MWYFLPLHCAFHVARTWANSKCEDINEILYHPSVYQGVGQRKFGGDGGGGYRPSQPPHKTPLYKSLKGHNKLSSKTVLLKVPCTPTHHVWQTKCLLRHVYLTSHKKFSEEKQAHVGMEASKTNQTRWESMTPQHFHTIPTSCAILPPLTQICFVFVSCVQRRVVEGSVVGSGGCVVHFDVHGEWVVLLGWIDFLDAYCYLIPQ